MKQSALLSSRKLSPAPKLALEELLGRPLGDDESVSVRAYQPHEAPSAEVRLAAMRGLEHYFADIDERLRSASSAELDEAVEEALRSVRPGYKPVR